MYPLHATQHTDGIVDHRAQYVAYAGVDDQWKCFQSRGLQSHHHGLAAERQYAARDERGD